MQHRGPSGRRLSMLLFRWHLRLVTAGVIPLLGLGLWWAAAQPPQGKAWKRTPLPEGVAPKKIEPPEAALTPAGRQAVAAAEKEGAALRQALATPFDRVEFKDGKKWDVQPVPAWRGRKPKIADSLELLPLPTADDPEPKAVTVSGADVAA